MPDLRPGGVMSADDLRKVLKEMAQRMGSSAVLAEKLGVSPGDLKQTIRGGPIKKVQADALGLEVCYRVRGKEG